MFGHQFYPTPQDVARKMVAAAGGDLSKMVILDPSAGKGDLLEAARWSGKADPKRMYACEIDPSLTAIITSRKYRVIAADYLQFQGRPDVNCILMNPPFDRGAQHLLHAWETLYQGVIVCLLNTASLNDTTDATTQRLSVLLKTTKADIQYLGNCFAQAERKTNVDVCMITIHKQAASAFDWGNYQQREAQEYELGQETAIAPTDAIRARVNAYDHGCQILVDSIMGLRKACQVLAPLFDRGEVGAMGYIVETMNPRNNGVANMDISAVIDVVTERAWADIFERTKIGNQVPSHLRAELDSKKEGTQKMAFTEANIWSILETLYANQGALHEATLQRAFDLMTKHNEKNRLAEKTWKTNSAFKVRKKFIMGNWAAGWTTTNSNRHNDMNDIDKAMCALTGKEYHKIQCIHSVRPGRDERIDGKMTFVPHPSQVMDADGSPKHNCFRSEFFHLQFYPATGSCHATFLDDGLWQDFNVAIAKINRWLPDDGQSGKYYDKKRKAK